MAPSFICAELKNVSVENAITRLFIRSGCATDKDTMASSPTDWCVFFPPCCLSSHLLACVGIGQSPDSSRCSVSPASAFAIATAAAGHGSPQGQETAMPADSFTAFSYDKAARRRSSHTILYRFISFRLQQLGENLRQGVPHPQGRHQPSAQRSAPLGFQTLAGLGFISFPVITMTRLAKRTWTAKLQNYRNSKICVINLSL